MFVLIGLIAGLTRAYLSSHDIVEQYSESLVVSSLYGALGGVLSMFIVQGSSFVTGFAVFVCAWAICDLLDSVVFFVMHPPWDILSVKDKEKRVKCFK